MGGWGSEPLEKCGKINNKVLFCDGKFNEVGVLVMGEKVKDLKLW